MLQDLPSCELRVYRISTYQTKYTNEHITLHFLIQMYNVPITKLFKTLLHHTVDRTIDI